MKTIFLMTWLVAFGAFAQQGLGPDNGGISHGNFLRIPDYKTTSAQSWFVNASTGNDSFDCRGASTPCLTIQGALNKVPKLLQHGATVTVAAGNYTGFAIDGFLCDPGVQTVTGGLSVDGSAAMTNSTLATGSATGTFTSSTAGSGTTFGTGTDSGATWTVNDLRGRFVVSAGQTRVISSNTATAITIVGTWTSPGAVGYAIKDPGVIINTAISAPASPTASASANAYAIAINNNQCGARNTAFLIRGMRLSNTLGAGIGYNDLSAVNFTILQLRNTAGGNAGFFSGQSTGGQSGDYTGGFFLTDIDVLGNGTNPGIDIGSGQATVQRVLVRGGAIGLRAGFNRTSTTGTTAQVVFSGFETQASTGAPIVVTQGSATISGARLDCSAAGGTAIVVGGQSASAATTANQYAFATLTSANISTCGFGIALSGSLSAADITAFTGTAATNAISVQGGGLVTFASAGTTIVGTTNDINIEAGGVTAALADVVAATCIQSAQFNSKVCKR